jgi:thioester reductase-like protein
VVHAAANVNGSLPYASLRTDTVLGTVGVLQLAAEVGAPLHHVSTTAAVPTPRSDTPRPGAVPLQGLPSGYAQSKWVAERLVDAARRRGLRAPTYRLGALGGHRRTAVSNERDFRWIFVRACLELRAAPHLPGDLCWVPVDVAAEAVAALALDDGPAAAARDTWQIAASTGVRWAEVFSWLRCAGHRLDVVEPDLWWELLRERLGDGPGLAAMAAFAPSLPSAAPRPDDGTWEALGAYGVTQEPFDRHLLLRCVARTAAGGADGKAKGAEPT